MSDYGPPLKQYNVMGTSEIRASRFIVVFIVITVILLAVIGMLVKQNLSLSRQNESLQDGRIMVGFPSSDDGVFISTKRIPDSHIFGFVSTFIDNYYNFNPDSAQTNANEALRLMSPRLRRLKQEEMERSVKQSNDQAITQIFIRSSPISIESNTRLGYVISFTAMRHRLTAGSRYETKKFNIKILIKPVKPSKFYDWAVVTDDIIAEEIK